jgi:5-methyltetrahydrofolate--homocysteine methyltransferase
LLFFPVEEGSAFPNHSESVTTRQTLNALLSRRILVMDGAMGTMIQSYRLDEAGFRGQRFQDHPGTSRGRTTSCP